MSIFKEPKIDCHTHVIDPINFSYGKDSEYKPSGQKIGTNAQLHQVMKTYGVSHSLLVQPNSGYGNDNSCMLDAIEHGEGRFKVIAIIDFDCDLAALRKFKRQGIVGAAFNPTFHGIDYYKRFADLIAKLAELDMFLQIQSEHDQVLMFVPWIEAMPIRVLIDHCGRPTPDAGLDQPGFMALLRLARTKRVSVKLSGYSKFSRLAYPFEDTWPYVRAIVDSFTLDEISALKAVHRLAQRASAYAKLLCDPRFLDEFAWLKFATRNRSNDFLKGFIRQRKLRFDRGITLKFLTNLKTVDTYTLKTVDTYTKT